MKSYGFDICGDFMCAHAHIYIYILNIGLPIGLPNGLPIALRTGVAIGQGNVEAVEGVDFWEGVGIGAWWGRVDPETIMY